MSDIVVGVDDTPRARRAVLEAADLAQRRGATLHVVAGYVPVRTSGRDREGAPADVEYRFGRGGELSRLMEETERALSMHGVRFKTWSASVQPARAIRRIAHRVEADTVVCGPELRCVNARSGPRTPRRSLARRVGRRARWEVVDLQRSALPPAPLAERPDAVGSASRSGSPHATKALILTTTAIFMALLDVTIVNTAFPAIARTFSGTALPHLSWVLNAYNVVFAALLMPAGRLADRIGRRRVFISGLLIFLVGSTLCGLAASVEMLIGARVIQAVGAAALMPSSLGLVLPLFAADRRSFVTSIWAAAGALAAAAGPSLGGVLVEAAGWRWVFFVNLVIATVFIRGHRVLPESLADGDRARPDLVGGLMLTLGVGAIALGVVEAPDWGWGSPATIGSAGVGVLLLVGLAAHSVGHVAPIIEPSLLRVRSLAVANLAVFVFAMGFYALLLGNILFLTSEWKYSILRAGFAVTPGPIAAALAARPAARLADRFGFRVVVAGSALLFAAACLAYRNAGGASPSYVEAWLPAQLLSGACIGALFSVLSAASIAELDPSRLATGTAMMSCFRQVGGVFGVAVLIAIIGTPGSTDALAVFHRAWDFEALTAIGTAVVALAFAGSRARTGRRRIARPASGCAVRTVMVEGHPVVLHEAGEGAPLLLLHGVLDTPATWRRVIPALAAHHRVIAPELYGPSFADPDGVYDSSLTGQARMLRGLLEVLGHERVAVVGHSLGGALALLMAWQHPERCRRVALIAPGGLGGEVHVGLRAVSLPGSGLILALVGSRPVAAALAVATRTIGRGAVAPLVRESLKLVEVFGDRRARAALLRNVRSVIGWRGQRLAGQRAACGHAISGLPTLIIWGLGDPILPHHHGIALHEQHPASELVVIDGAGHLPHVQHATVVADRLNRFLHEETLDAPVLDQIESGVLATSVSDVARVAGDARRGESKPVEVALDGATEPATRLPAAAASGTDVG